MCLTTVNFTRAYVLFHLKIFKKNSMFIEDIIKAAMHFTYYPVESPFIIGWRRQVMFCTRFSANIAERTDFQHIPRNFLC